MRTLFAFLLLAGSSLAPAQNLAITGFSPRCGGFVGTFRADADTTARLLAVSDAGTTATGPWAPLSANTEATLKVGDLPPSSANYRVLVDPLGGPRAQVTRGAGPWDVVTVASETSYGAPIQSLDVTAVIPLDSHWLPAFETEFANQMSKLTPDQQAATQQFVNALVLGAYERVQDQKQREAERLLITQPGFIHNN